MMFLYLICLRRRHKLTLLIRPHWTLRYFQGLASYIDLTMIIACLTTLNFKECGVHVYVGKVCPTMGMKTNDGKDCYDLWFILEAKPNRAQI